MEAIFFRGGDLDGNTRVSQESLDEVWLAFDGLGGAASARGRYDRTNETVEVSGVVYTVWQAAPSAPATGTVPPY